MLVEGCRSFPWNSSRCSSGVNHARDREATIGSSEFRKRVGHRLAYDHQRGRCKDDEGDEERDSRLHGNTTRRGRGRGRNGRTKAACAHRRGGKVRGFRLSHPRATSVGTCSSAHETFKAVSLWRASVRYSGFRRTYFKAVVVI